MATLTRNGRTIVVPDETAADYIARGWADPSAPPPIVIPEGEPSDRWKNEQLDAYGVREGIDLTSASTKADRLDLIARHSS